MWNIIYTFGRFWSIIINIHPIGITVFSSWIILLTIRRILQQLIQIPQLGKKEKGATEPLVVQLPNIHNLLENFKDNIAGDNRDIYRLSVTGRVMHFQDTFYHEKKLQHHKAPRMGKCQYNL